MALRIGATATLLANPRGFASADMVVLGPNLEYFAYCFCARLNGCRKIQNLLSYFYQIFFDGRAEITNIRDNRSSYNRRDKKGDDRKERGAHDERKENSQ
jgi:hypothetical protein